MNKGDNKQQQQRRINIELGDAEAEGIYSNLAMINVSGSEFVLDFARVMPGRNKAKIYARLIMAPANAKALLRGLEQNVKRYEEIHGSIGEGALRGNIGFSSDERPQ